MCAVQKEGTLIKEYERQQTWREWSRYLDCIPIETGQKIIDLGCGLGEVSARICEEWGCDVFAVDSDIEMLNYLKVRQLEKVHTEHLDLKMMAPRAPELIDGIWCGFSLAYFVDAERYLRMWTNNMTRLAPNAWIAVLEIDRLFSGHAPLDVSLKTKLDKFELGMAERKVYDFRMGGRAQSILENLGFEILHLENPRDPELNFDGPASAMIQNAWRKRIERMVGLKKEFGEDFSSVRDNFLSGLANPHHTCDNTLRFVVGQWRGNQG